MGLLTAAEVASMVDVANELANATLIEIAEPGPTAGNGDPGTPVAVWTGEAPAHFQRSRRTATSGDREVPQRGDTLLVYDSTAAALEFAGTIDAASTVVIVDRTRATPVTSRWTVKGTVKETEGTLDSITLELESERAP